jgi:hypothetical protein
MPNLATAGKTHERQAGSTYAGAKKKAAHLGRPEIAEDFDSLAGRRMLRPDMN